MKITDLISEPPLSYRISEKDKDSKVSTSGQDSRPGGPRSRTSDQENLGAGSLTYEEKGLVDDELQDFHGISGFPRQTRISRCKKHHVPHP